MKLKICKDCKIEKSTESFYISKKSGLWPNCKACVKVKQAQNYQQNRIYIDARQKRYNSKHENKLKTYQKQYQLDNKETIKIQKAEYAKNNVKKLRKIQKTWRQRHPDRKLADTRKRQIQKLHRTPKWLTKSDWIEINWAYTYAKQLTKETGIKHEVDHIIPLRGKNISGLHCPQNLQILTKDQHKSKSNKWPYIIGK